MKRQAARLFPKDSPVSSCGVSAIDCNSAPIFQPPVIQQYGSGLAYFFQFTKLELSKLYIPESQYIYRYALLRLHLTVACLVIVQ